MLPKFYIDYFSKQIWRALGLTVDNNVSILLASEQINKRPNDYWLTVMDVARRFELRRVLAYA